MYRQSWVHHELNTYDYIFQEDKYIYILFYHELYLSFMHFIIYYYLSISFMNFIILSLSFNFLRTFKYYFFSKRHPPPLYSAWALFLPMMPHTGLRQPMMPSSQCCLLGGVWGEERAGLAVSAAHDVLVYINSMIIEEQIID